MSFKPQDQKAHMRKRHSLKGTLHYLLPEHVLQVVLLIQGSTKSKQKKSLLLRAILLKFSKSIPIAPPFPPPQLTGTIPVWPSGDTQQYSSLIQSQWTHFVLHLGRSQQFLLHPMAGYLLLEHPHSYTASYQGGETV